MFKSLYKFLFGEKQSSGKSKAKASYEGPVYDRPTITDVLSLEEELDKIDAQNTTSWRNYYN